MQVFSSESILKMENILDTSWQWDILAWRNQSEVRRNMIDDTEIDEATHESYLNNLKRSDSRRVYVLTDCGEPLMVQNVKVDEERKAFFNGWYSIRGSKSPSVYPLYVTYMVRDSLLAMHPGFDFRSQVLSSNEHMWRFLERLGGMTSDPYPMELKSGRIVDVRDVHCDGEMWETGSKKMRGLYERVLNEARYAQKELVW